jgi:hypothetical protein
MVIEILVANSKQNSKFNSMMNLLNKFVIFLSVLCFYSVNSENSCVQETVTDCDMTVYCVTQVMK